MKTRTKLYRILREMDINGRELAKMRKSSPQAAYSLIKNGVKTTKVAQELGALLEVDPLFLLEL